MLDQRFQSIISNNGAAFIFACLTFTKSSYQKHVPGGVIAPQKYSPTASHWTFLTTGRNELSYALNELSDSLGEIITPGQAKLVADLLLRFADDNISPVQICNLDRLASLKLLKNKFLENVKPIPILGYYHRQGANLQSEPPILDFSLAFQVNLQKSSSEFNEFLTLMTQLQQESFQDALALVFNDGGRTTMTYYDNGMSVLDLDVKNWELQLRDNSAVAANDGPRLLEILVESMKRISTEDVLVTSGYRRCESIHRVSEIYLREIAMQALGASFAINQDKLIVSVGGRPHWIMEHYFQPTVTIENAAVLLDVERDRFQIEGVFRGTNAIRILQGISTTSANCECGCHFPQHPANLPLTNTVSLRTTLIEKRQSQCSCLDWKKVCSPISYMEEQQWNQLFEINGVFGS